MRFPFTDLTTTKKRPAIVVSSAAYHRARRDLILMGVTSSARPESGIGRITFLRWREAGLLKPSATKPIFMTIDRRLILRRLGRLEPPDRAAVQQVLESILGE